MSRGTILLSRKGINAFHPSTRLQLADPTRKRTVPTDDCRSQPAFSKSINNAARQHIWRWNLSAMASSICSGGNVVLTILLVGHFVFHLMIYILMRLREPRTVFTGVAFPVLYLFHICSWKIVNKSELKNLAVT